MNTTKSKPKTMIEISDVYMSPQAERDNERILKTAVYGNRYMLRQIAKGERDKRVSERRARQYEVKIKNKINGICQQSITTCYWGYKYYKKLKVHQAFYVVPVGDKIPYAIIVAVNPKTRVATVMRIIVHSDANVRRILKGKGVTEERCGDNKHKYCSISNRNPYARHIYESQRRRRERLNRLRLERLEKEERYLRMKERLGNW